MAEKRDDEGIEEARERLLAFLTDMNRWEAGMVQFWRDAEKMTSEEAFHSAMVDRRQQLVDVYVRHCEAGENAERLTDAGISSPGDKPQHDPTDEIVAAQWGDGKAVFDVQQKYGTRKLMRYDVLMRDGRWWVRDNAKHYDKSADAWVADLT